MYKLPIIKVVETDAHILNMRTRFPFRYGIASLTSLPHLFLRAKVSIDGMGVVDGLTSEGLPPKWFTKDPNTTFEEDIPAFFDSINFACESAKAAPQGTWFQMWKEVHARQNANNWPKSVPPLLANLGVALIERATIDALSRGLGMRLHQILTRNYLGMDLSNVREGLAKIPLAEPILGTKPLESGHVRHTVGLGDPLTSADIEGGKGLEDGLPYTLEENINEYGLGYFKIKLSGDNGQDMDRIGAVADILGSCDVERPRFTLDGNEQYRDLATFREFYGSCLEVGSVREFFQKGLLFIEQPLHRDVAFAIDLNSWKDAPPIVLDESDADLDSLPTALELGYQGCSFKNCKGIVKGLANAALLAQYRSKDNHKQYIQSAEDLANVGPIALNQDLALVASLGITHVERNGHHYFRGLSMFPEDMWDEIAEPGLYKFHDQGFPTLDIQSGCLDLRHITRTSYGTSNLMEIERFTPLADWSPSSLA